VRLGEYRPGAKTHSIVAVGRFFAAGHSKRQDALVKAFRSLPQSFVEAWSLTLVGGVSQRKGDLAYLESVRALARGAPNVNILINVSQNKLTQLYEAASLFWHATGYGRPMRAPERAEHFGMTTIEAMSYGAVPCVYADGGQVEVVSGEFGCLWSTLEELCSATVTLGASPDQLATRAARAASAASSYGGPQFEAGVNRVLARLRD
jgi:glycosyltransferase involved in cell wall biosynthesis